MNTSRHSIGNFLLSMGLRPNLSTADRIIRVLFSVVVVMPLLVSIEASGWSVLFAVFSLPLLITAAIAWDPFYARLGITTVKQSMLDLPNQPSGILISEAYAERLRRARYPTRYTVRDSTV